MPFKRVHLLLGFALLIVRWGIAAGADPRADWDSLQQLQPGDRVRVYVRHHETVNALFGAVTPETLQLAVKNNQIEFARQDVRRVERLRRRSAARAAAPWIGAAAGFGIGFAIGWSQGDDTSHGTQGWACFPICIPKYATGSAVGGVMAVGGAVAGHFIAGKQSDVIYRSR